MHETRYVLWHHTPMTLAGISCRPDVLEDAELTTGDSQAALLYVQGHDADKFSQQALQPVQEGEQKVHLLCLHI